MAIEQVNDKNVIARIIPDSIEEKFNLLLKTTPDSNIKKYKQNLISEIHKQSLDPKSIEILVKYYESCIEDINKKLKESEKLAGEDSLTGLYTRRMFNRDLENRCEKSDVDERRCDDRRGHFSIIIYDLNDLKRINDSLGHDKGDEALILLSKTIQKNLRKFDNAYRIGGDEFASIHPNTTIEQALKIAQEIYSKNVSIGISGSHVLRKKNIKVTSELIYKTADQAMYISKQQKQKPILWTAKLLNT